MNKKQIFLIVFIFFILLKIGVIFSAPLLETLVINKEEKLCGLLWGGDERFYYEIPEGWIPIYEECYLKEGIEQNINNIICQKLYEGYEDDRSYYLRFDFCKELEPLGYTDIGSLNSYYNLPKKKTNLYYTLLWNQIITDFFWVIIFYIILIPTTLIVLTLIVFRKKT